MFVDIARNRTQHPNGRRYSMKTLAWSREIRDISPRPWEIVRRVLPLPGDRLLLSTFSYTWAVTSSAPLDLDEMEALINLSQRSHEDTMTDRRVILSVKTIAFHPMVTISGDPKPPKKLINVLSDSGRSCEIRFSVMGQTISVHRVMTVSGDKSKMFLASGLAQAPFNLCNSAFSNKSDFLTRKLEKQSIMIDSRVTSADSTRAGEFKMILSAFRDILACLSASPPGSRSIATEPERHN
jgi:hypothetical protein